MWLVVLLVVIAAIIMSIIMIRHDSTPSWKKFAEFLRPPWMRGRHILGFGNWYYGDWDLGERVNDAITAGKREAMRQARRKRRQQ